MLDQLGEKGKMALKCGSHITRLMSKLPQDMLAEFMRHLHPLHISIPTLVDFADWLEFKLKIKEYGYRSLYRESKENTEAKRDKRKDSKSVRTTTVLHGAEQTTSGSAIPQSPSTSVSPPGNRSSCRAHTVLMPSIF